MDWREQFRAGQVWLATRASANPDRGVVVADHHGNQEAYAWDVKSGQLQRLSETGTAVLEAAIRPDGRNIVYHRDLTGAEFGHLHSVPFEGGGATDLTPTLEEYVATHIRATTDVVTAIAATNNRQYLLCIRGETVTRWPQGPLVQHACLAEDGASIAIGEAMEGLFTRTVVRSLGDGSVIDQLDMSHPGVFRHKAVAVAVHRDGWLRPAIWRPGSEPELLAVTMPGDVEPAGWSDDGMLLLLLQWHRSRGGLYLYDIDSRRASQLQTPDGAPSPWTVPELHGRSASVLWSDARTPWRVTEIDADSSHELLRVSRRDDYPGAAWQEVTFSSSDGAVVQGWLLTPAGERPWPAILFAHGGPTYVASPTFNIFCQAWADSGFAVLSVNYRGSTTFGDAYREALTGDIGGVDVADMVAGRRWLVDSGTAVPDLVIINGFSYGGYLTLQCMGTHPDLFAAGIAGAPITDFILSREDQNASLDAYLLALFGSDPDEDPESRRRASPRTYIDRFAAPVLISALEADTRTPLRPIRVFVDEMLAAGKDVRLELLRGGHMGVGAEQDIAIMESWIDFANEIVDQRRAGARGAGSTGT